MNPKEKNFNYDELNCLKEYMSDGGSFTSFYKEIKEAVEAEDCIYKRPKEDAFKRIEVEKLEEISEYLDALDAMAEDDLSKNLISKIRENLN